MPKHEIASARFRVGDRVEVTGFGPGEVVAIQAAGSRRILYRVWFDAGWIGAAAESMVEACAQRKCSTKD